MNPTPFLPPYNVRFRRGAKAPPGSDLTAADVECQASGVHACYGKEDAMMRGWVEFPNEDFENGYSEAIEWSDL